jgi:hypothetical protein
MLLTQAGCAVRDGSLPAPFGDRRRAEPSPCPTTGPVNLTSPSGAANNPSEAV